MSEHADVVVVGIGPGGEELAGRLAEAGLGVIGIDDSLVGGECPYWGCVPSKMMIRAADLLAEGRRVNGMSGHATVTPDWGVVARRIRDDATDNWDDTVAVERLEAKGATVVRGRARLTGNDSVEVDGTTYRADRALVLDTGTAPWAPPIAGLGDVPYWTNHQAIEADVLPEALAVLGGGAIGLEIGQLVARFGVAVTIVEVGDRLLAPEEPESSALITEVLAAEGLRIETGAVVERVDHDASGFHLALTGRPPVDADRLLVATGRRPDLAALGVGALGLDESARSIPVDEFLRVVPGVWAIGDVTGKGAFTHVSMYQAKIAIADILGQETSGADYRALPRVTFTDPEIGSVGMTEAEARHDGRAVRTGTAPIPTSTRGWIHKAGNHGYIKLVEDAERSVLVGATSAGPMGGEVLGLLALAVHAAVPVAELRRMIFAYPTFHRAIEAALDDLG
jgi:pyruvate/2-oxoglutarate dehydrogenase complex dihydrolipoamide dehydrogenase (E3) component